jgi:hypothetical protein
VGIVDYNSVESLIFQREQCEVMRLQLNEGQRMIFDRVENALDTGRECLLYIPGSGGTGKTFLFKSICYLVRSRGRSVLATAWTGNAAALLEGGQTCHSRFGLPVPFTAESTCQFSAGSRKANEIRDARVILGDEASIMPGYFLKELDRLCRFFTNVNMSFGGKIVLLSGDFRQTLPVCKGASHSEIFQLCLNQQELFREKFVEMGLNQNMRLEPGQDEYLAWLDALGVGQLPRYEGLNPDLILIPEHLVLQDRVVQDANGVEIRQPATEQDLIDFVFESPFNVEASYTQSRAIFAPLNTDTMHINDLIYDLLPGM